MVIIILKGFILMFSMLLQALWLEEEVQSNGGCRWGYKLWRRKKKEPGDLCVK